MNQSMSPSAFHAESADSPEFPASRMPYGSIVWCVVMALALPALLAFFLDNDGVRERPLYRQNICAVVSLVLLAAALLSLVGPRALRPAVRTFPLIVAGGCILLLGLILWNKLFIASYAKSPFGADIFRPMHYNTHAPLYARDARLARTSPAWTVIPVAFAAVSVAGLILGFKRFLRARAAGLILAGFFIIMAVALEVPDGLQSNLPYHRTDSTNFKGVRHALRSYVKKMPFLTDRSQHYPPGLVVLYEIENTVGFRYIARPAAILLPAISILLAGSIARRIGLTRPAANLAMLLLATSASFMIFPMITDRCFFIFFSTATILLFVRGLQRGDLLSPILMGVAFALYTLCTFGAYMLAIHMAAFAGFALLFRSVAWTRIAKIVVISIAAYAGFFLLFYLTTRFNIVACFRKASELHLEQSGPGYDVFGRYLLRSFGGILAYLTAIGFPLCVLAYCALRRQADPRRSGDGDGADPVLIRPFIWATTLAIILIGFSGMIFLETERIWLPFSPLLAICAGYELHRRAAVEGRLAIFGATLLSLTFALGYGLPFEHRLGPRTTSLNVDRPEKSPASRPTRATKKEGPASRSAKSSALPRGKPQ